MADFRALAASVSFTTESTPAPRKVAEQPRATAAASKPESPPAPHAKLTVPLSLAPSVPRLPLIDPTHPAPASATPANRPEPPHGATNPTLPVGTQLAFARPPDLLAEIAASRPRQDKKPLVAKPRITTPATGGAAAADVNLAPTTTQSAAPNFAAGRPAASTLRGVAGASVDPPLKPAVVTAPIAPPVIAATPAAAPSSALAAPQTLTVRVASSAAVKPPATPAVASPPVLPAAPAAVPPPPKATPADAGEMPPWVADAPTRPVRPSPFRLATTQKAVLPVEPPPKPHALPAAAKSAAAPASSAAPKPVRGLDQTQTVRALTSLELADSDSSRLFVIQLAVSESEFRPEEIPNLGIFEEYRLYSTMGLDGDKVLHALRLGFFTDEGAAGAVAGYLRSHFESAVLKRISTAERDRFAEQRVRAQKDAGATGIHSAIELRSPDLKTTTSLADLTQRASRRRSD